MEKGELVLEDRLYSDTHEWVKKVGEKRYQIGITDYAQHNLKDIYAIELPKIGEEVKQFEKYGWIEASKASSDLYSPVSGQVVSVNKDSFGEINYLGTPDPKNIRYEGDLFNINKKPYETWLIEIETDDESQLEKLLKPDDYKKEIEKYKKSDKA